MAFRPALFITGGAAYASRYFFVLPWLAAPSSAPPELAFWLLFGCIAFSIARTLAKPRSTLGAGIYAAPDARPHQRHHLARRPPPSRSAARC